MNLLDILILAVVGVSGLMSLRAGLVREVFSLGALLVGILTALILTRSVAPSLPVFFESQAVTQILAFLVIFLVVYLIISLVGSLIARVIRSIKLGWADHLLGLAFGFLRGAVIAVLLLVGFILVMPAGHRLLQESRARKLADGPIDVFADLLPGRARELVLTRHDAVLEAARRRQGGQDRPASSPSPGGRSFEGRQPESEPGYQREGGREENERDDSRGMPA
ncbi:MAG: CvpA family protein [Candidatus Eisenbacteria bacterium]|nr:CvpA family protein [Candidatus Eisenbacteria bacterium]